MVKVSCYEPIVTTTAPKLYTKSLMGFGNPRATLPYKGRVVFISVHYHLLAPHNMHFLAKSYILVIQICLTMSSEVVSLSN